MSSGAINTQSEPLPLLYLNATAVSDKSSDMDHIDPSGTDIGTHAGISIPRRQQYSTLQGDGAGICNCYAYAGRQQLSLLLCLQSCSTESRGAGL